MDRRNFLQNLGLLGVIPLIPAWIDKEQFKDKKVTRETIAKEYNLPPGKLPKGENLVIYVDGKMVGYTPNAIIDLTQDHHWEEYLKKYVSTSKEWGINFENLEGVYMPELPELMESSELSIKYSKGKKIYSGKGYLTELNCEAPYNDHINISGRIEGNGELKGNFKVRKIYSR